MIADESRPIPALGNLAAGILELGAFCREIVFFIEHELPIWRQRSSISAVEDESRLNQSLCLHLDKVSRRNFNVVRFLQEPLQGPNRNADLGVFPLNTLNLDGTNFDDEAQLLPIECKRLPTPPGNRRSDLEYVHGQPGHRTGGIERFKHGLHGPKNQHALMIGYVQAKAFEHWLGAINERLAKLAKGGADEGLWNPAERLDTEASGPSAKVQRLASRHQRRRPPCASGSVNMQHLWLLMN